MTPHTNIIIVEKSSRSGHISELYIKLAWMYYFSPILSVSIGGRLYKWLRLDKTIRFSRWRVVTVERLSKLPNVSAKAESFTLLG